MKTLAILAFALLLAGGAALPARAGDDALTARVQAFVDECHADAAHARPAFFDKTASHGSHLGTHPPAQWHRDAFQASGGY